MNYAYNITVNFKDELLNFYEWSKEDNIEIINKLNIFWVNKKTYNELLKMNIKVDASFIDKIKSNNFTCIFTNEIDTVCIKFNINGKINKISKLLFEDEDDILDGLTIKNKIDLKYIKLEKSINYNKYTRYEKQNINEILGFINNEKNNENVINYLYYEWFKKIGKDNKYEKLIKSINSNYSKKHDDFLKIIKLCSENV